MAGYAPVAFEKFPFDKAGEVFSFPTPSGGEASDDGFVSRQTANITLEDLDSNGTVTIDVPDTRWTEFYVTTEGVGPFGLESPEGEDDLLTVRGAANTAAATYGRDSFWTSWTAAKTTWPILAKTDAGNTPEQVVLRVAGYDDGDFEFRVFGQFAEGEQP